MKAMRKLLGFRFSTEKLDGHFAQLTFFLVGLMILSIGFHKLTTLTLNPTEAFFGILLVLILGTQCIGLGSLILLLSYAMAKKREETDLHR